MAESEEELKSLLMKVKRRVNKLAQNSTFRKLRSWHPVPSPHANKWGNNGNSNRLSFLAPKSLQTVTAAMKLKDACFLEEKLWPWSLWPRSHKISDNHWATFTDSLTQSEGFWLPLTCLEGDYWQCWTLPEPAALRKQWQLRNFPPLNLLYTKRKAHPSRLTTEDY